ncbi:MAG: ABC transporter ATP-binding protein/permease [Clostridia bacterium]|nr:ABC transporter ATP-binding protein/permease [Clostridia bacterium]
MSGQTAPKQSAGSKSGGKKHAASPKVSLPLFGIPRLLPFAKPYRKHLLGLVIAQVLCSISDVLRPVLQKFALDHFVRESTLTGIVPFAAAYALLIVLTAVVSYYGVRGCLSTEVRMNRDMRNRAFAHLQELSFDYYNQNSVGYIHARVMSDTSRIGELFTWQLFDGTYFALFVLGAAVVMLQINVRLTGLVFLVVPVIALLFAFFQKKLFDLHHQVREINSHITGNFNEGIIGAKTIKSLAAEEKTDFEFREETSNMKYKVLQSARTYGAFSMITNLASSCALALVLWKGGILAADQVGTFSLFMSYAQDLMEPVRWLVEVLSLLVQAQVNIGRFTDLLNMTPTVTDRPDVIEKYGDCFTPHKENWEPIKGDIEFKHVDFKYPDGDEYILQDFNLKIPFGTNVAIVGETGAGKSTLASLICRFYEPTRGRLLVDGRDARDRSQLWLHSALGYVLQAPHLFSGTIRDNLIYGKPDATEEEIDRAIRLVSLDSVISKLEKGLDTNVGEGGDLLSTGEKQLISFARAILADPRIVVLDEATASVDTLTEQKIQSAIDQIIRGRTSIVIAHRLSTVKDADIILVVDDGKIIEQGRHEDLLAAKGHYFNLWTRQYEDAAISAVWGKKA